MEPMKLPMTGSCRCGKVRFEVAKAPVMTAACHCTGCQKMSGGAFSLTAIVPADGFRVTDGSPVVGGMHGPDLHHFFCPHCMTWMFTRVEGFDAVVNVRPTMLEDPSWFSPFIETMTREKLPWAETPARHRFDGFPPMEQFGALMQEFAEAWRAPGDS
jgi:hypothetical protein